MLVSVYRFSLFTICSFAFCMAAQASPQAAQEIAEKDPACQAIQPFYWEIGNGQAILASGSTGNKSVQRNTFMRYASASKLVFGAYVAERRAGNLTAEDLKALRMQTGFMSRQFCRPQETVGSCAKRIVNYTPAQNGKFFYGNGHFQSWGYYNGLALLNKESLIREYQRVLGRQLGMGFQIPTLSGGMQGTPEEYARFLQRIVRGELKINSLLGTNPVCTNPQTCATATFSPLKEYNYHYSIGHWVEDDPRDSFSDGAFSSAGLFGFYPWISVDKKSYGIVAREVQDLGAGNKSLNCGKRIRKAFLTAR